MSFKAVELQIAVPRTSEAGRYQNEAQQRPVIDQNLLAEQTAKEANEARQRSEALDETAHTDVRDGQSRNKEQQSGSNEPEVTSALETVKPAEHPYKGKHIDLSL
ncbi:hypothetical protein P4H27_19825 [Paenibacillus taichungensis]|uniref:RNA polymerase subunit sigma n=1 Tax=Paenibacillus taichungensis TaxID=484184 RepID=A0ABX2MH54_9BACL|nr:MULTISPECIES: hypothetical protein [Paenibacillus]OME81761.1 hypothetical protein BK122_13930 [Paenibacillus pabuli]MDR9745097.1 hypothetical protein [Paenibacillus taichungensis]MEC0109217.1 hypothetical protein [Paenibacillus taichungensis]MEC0198658.1 hypothetical protein [Paenibacillus taichungensis]NUU54004.1 hypothetical protein [Paenibacillus taichungensis]